MPGLMTSAVTPGQSMRRGLGQLDAGVGRGLARRGVVVPGDAVDARRHQGAHRRQAGAREPQHDERRTLEDGEIDHPLT